MPASAFGVYDFLVMEQRPAAPAQKIQLESRAGVAGNAAWSTGVRSEPQQISTIRDVATYSDAVNLCASYEGIVGTVVTIIYGGVALLYSALILSVDAQPEAIVGGVGGIAGSSRALVRARWTIETRA